MIGDVVVTESFPRGVELVRPSRPCCLNQRWFDLCLVNWWDVRDVVTGREIVNFTISPCDVVRVIKKEA